MFKPSALKIEVVNNTRFNLTIHNFQKLSWRSMLPDPLDLRVHVTNYLETCHQHFWSHPYTHHYAKY